jgi:sulfoxide reductase heme-binding subunit YedZ
MTSGQKNWAALAAAVFVSGLVSTAYLSLNGPSDDNLRFVLRLTARSAFLIFLLAFIARPLQQVFPTAATHTLLRYRRQIGVAFAGVHTVHLLVILTRVQLVPEFQLTAKNHLGAITYLLILLMLITSFDGPARSVGRKNWKILHKTGLYVIAVSFIQTLLPNSEQELYMPEYILFSSLIFGAILLRMTAFFNTRKTRRATERPQ